MLSAQLSSPCECVDFLSAVRTSAHTERVEVRNITEVGPRSRCGFVLQLCACSFIKAEPRSRCGFDEVCSFILLSFKGPQSTCRLFERLEEEPRSRCGFDEVCSVIEVEPRSRCSFNQLGPRNRCRYTETGPRSRRGFIEVGPRSRCCF